MLKQPTAGLSLIVARDRSGVIGKNNGIPWRIPSDLKRFKQITFGHPVIMGRRNWESIPQKYRPLPGRTNIVLTRRSDYHALHAAVAHSIENAYATAIQAPGAEEIFVIGGEEVYRLFLPYAVKIYLTEVDVDIQDDGHCVRFPDPRRFDWKETEVPIGTSDPRDEYRTLFRILERTR